MRYTEHLLLAVLLVPTAAIVAAAVIALAGHPEAPAEQGVKPTAPAYYYVDLEMQP